MEKDVLWLCGVVEREEGGGGGRGEGEGEDGKKVRDKSVQGFHYCSCTYVYVTRVQACKMRHAKTRITILLQNKLNRADAQ